MIQECCYDHFFTPAPRTFLELDDTPQVYSEGSVLFMSATSIAVDNDNFFWNDSENSLGIGTNTIDQSAKVHIDSVNKGFLPPRMTQAQRDSIVSPAQGLMVYNTTENQYNFFSDTSWKAIGFNIKPTAVDLITPNTGDVIIEVTDTSALRTITISNDDIANKNIIIVKDSSGAASVNNIRIIAEGGQLIEGDVEKRITVDNGDGFFFTNGNKILMIT